MNLKAHNPFVKLSTKLLLALVKQPGCFVREFYPRGGDEHSGVIPFLLTHYSHHDIDRERAQKHFRTLKNDRYRFLYDSSNPEHLRKLEIAAQQPAGYKIFINILPAPWKASDHLKTKIYRYLAVKYPEWKTVGDKKLNIALRDLFGKLYLYFRWQGNKVEVLLEEVENH
jgi:hypothetical protein